MRFATAISLLSFTLGASAAALHKRDIDTGFWQIISKPFGDSSDPGTPVVLGSDPSNSGVRIPFPPKYVSDISYLVNRQPSPPVPMVKPPCASSSQRSRTGRVRATLAQR